MTSGSRQGVDGGTPGHPAAFVQLAVFALGAVVLAAMSFAAHNLAYFPFDVTISHGVQAYHPGWLDTATSALSWTGFPPQSDVLFGAMVVLLVVLGHRWAATMEVGAAIGMASDVLAGCLLGVLWLAVTIRIYAWCEARFSRRTTDPTRQRPGAPIAMDHAQW